MYIKSSHEHALHSITLNINGFIKVKNLVMCSDAIWKIKPFYDRRRICLGKLFKLIPDVNRIKLALCIKYENDENEFSFVIFL